MSPSRAFQAEDTRVHGGEDCAQVWGRAGANKASEEGRDQVVTQSLVGVAGLVSGCDWRTGGTHGE